MKAFGWFGYYIGSKDENLCVKMLFFIIGDNQSLNILFLNAWFI
jgi:hypothetical protein